MIPAPTLDAPPGSQPPSGLRWLYTAPDASCTGVRVEPLTTSVVPSAVLHAPGDMARTAICAAQPSVIPALSGVPAGMPVRAAAASDTTPMVAPGRTTGGSSTGSRPSRPNTSVGQRRL